MVSVLAKICPKCKVENLDDANFCDNCRNDLTSIESKSENRRSKNSKSIIVGRSNKFKTILGISIVLGILIAFGVFSMVNTQSFPTYSDDQISFKYIDGWKIVKSNSNNSKIIEGHYDFVGPIDLTIKKNTSNGYNLTDFKSIWMDETFKNGNKLTSENSVTVDGVNAYELTSKSSNNGKSVNHKYILLLKNNTAYIIIFNTETDLLSYRRSIDTIVNSFHVK